MPAEVEWHTYETGIYLRDGRPRRTRVGSSLVAWVVALTCAVMGGVVITSIVGGWPFDLAGLTVWLGRGAG